MELQSLTPRGILKFRDMLQEARDGGSPVFGDLLTSPGLTTGRGIEIGQLPSLKKRAVAKYLFETLSPLGDPAVIEKDVGLWAWLTLFWIDELVPKKPDGTRPVKSNYRWIPEPDNYKNYYRHFLALPYRMYAKHHEKPDVAAALFTGRIGVPGELTEQIASNQEIIANPSLLETAASLYVNISTDELKLGAGGNGPGTPRRFAAVINQLFLTYDIATVNPKKLLSMLPGEFDKFKV